MDRSKGNGRFKPVNKHEDPRDRWTKAPADVSHAIASASTSKVNRANYDVPDEVKLAIEMAKSVTRRGQNFSTEHV
jgi:hypothetical protein